MDLGPLHDLPFEDQDSATQDITLATPNNGVGLRCALAHADSALSLAFEFGRPELIAKAQIFRGHCLRRMGRWRDAYQAYVRAACVRHFAADHGPGGLEALTAECARRAEQAEKEKVARIKHSRGVKDGGGSGGGNSGKGIGWLALGYEAEKGGPEEETQWGASPLILRDGRGNVVSSRTKRSGLRTVKGKAFDSLVPTLNPDFSHSLCPSRDGRVIPRIYRIRISDVRSAA